MFWHFFCLALNKDGNVHGRKLVLSRVGGKGTLSFFVSSSQVVKHRRCCLWLWWGHHRRYFIVPYRGQSLLRSEEVPGIQLCDTAEGRKVPCVSLHPFQGTKLVIVS